MERYIEVRYQELLPAKTLEEYLLHVAACEWSVIEPIIINDESEILANGWKERELQPFTHQFRNLIYFFRKLPCALIVDDVGLGKTISAGLILSELIVRKRVRRALIVAPKILCMQWHQELEKKFGLSSIYVESSQDFRKYLGAQDCQIIITTYQIVSNNISLITPDLFQAGIFDEAHKLRNLYGNAKAPQIAQRLKEAFHRKIFRFVLMLTATPIQNKIWDIYSLIDLLKIIEGEDNPFGTPKSFRDNYLSDGKGILLQESKKKSFRQILQKTLCRTRRSGTRLPFPTRNIRDEAFELSSREIRLLRAQEKFFEEDSVKRLTQINMARALMSSPQAFLAQLRNSFEDDQRYAGFISEIEQLTEAIDFPEKMRKVLTFLMALRDEATKQCRSWRAIIFTTRLETLKMIGACLQNAGISYGFIRGGKQRETDESIREYQCEPPEINVIISMDSGAEGVNLQAGNVVINYDLPWNPMVIEQRIGRVQRLGSSFKEVIVFNPYALGTVEEVIVLRLLQKLNGISQALGDIESILESCGFKEDKFEKDVARIVLAALKHQNYEERTRRLQGAMEEGSRYYREHQHEIEESISETIWEEELSPQNRPPRLTPQLHSMTDIDFYRATSSKMVFPREFEDSSILQNSEDFQKQLAKWRKTASACVVDVRVSEREKHLERVKIFWESLFPATHVEKIRQVGAPEWNFQGELLLEMEITNAVDRLQKVTSIPFCTLPGAVHDISNLPTTEERFEQKTNLDFQMSDTITATTIRDAVREDADAKLFTEFYERRVKEKQDVTQNDALRHKIFEDYSPNISATVNGAHGFRYEKFVWNVRYTIQNHDYTQNLTEIPCIAHFAQIATGTCEVLGERFPESVLETCQETEKRVVRHLLVTLPDDRRVLESETAICGICQKLGLKTEMALSPVSNVFEHLSHRVRCAYSQELGFPEEMETSEFSGRTAFSKFFQTSDKSGRKGILDEFVTCAKTGKKLLKDEVGLSMTDGQWYDLELLVTLEGGRYALESETAICGICQKLGLKTEMAISPVSNVFEHLSHRIRCAYSQELGFPEEMETSEFSGRTAFSKFFQTSDKSGRKGILDEFVTCAKTGKNLLKDEAEIRKKDGLWYDSAFFGTSALSGERELAEGLAECEVSHTWVLVEELVECDWSHRRIRKDWSAISPISGRVFDKNRGILSKDGKFLPPDEICPICEISMGEDVSRIVNPKSGRLCHEDHFATSCVTGEVRLKNELGMSDFSQNYVENEYLHFSDISGRRALESEMCVCERTGKKILRDEAVYSKPDRKWYLQELCVQSEVSGEWGLRENALRCAISNHWMFPSESVLCEDCHKPIEKRLAAISPVSGKIFAKKFGCRTLSGELLRKEEVGFCSWQNGYLRKSEVGQCSGTRLSFEKKWLLKGCFYGLYDFMIHLKNETPVQQEGWMELPLSKAAFLSQIPGWDSDYAPSETCRCYLFPNPNGTVAMFVMCNKQKKLLGFSSACTYYYGFIRLPNSSGASTIKAQFIGTPFKVAEYPYNPFQRISKKI